MDIAIVYNNDSTGLVGTFCHLIDNLYPGLNMSLMTVVDQARLSALDTARYIVLFISQQFLQSEGHMQELHLALNRQRSSKTDILYLIKTGPLRGRPFFPRVLKYDLVLSDPVWEKFDHQCFDGKKHEKKVVFSKVSRMGHSHTFTTHYREYFAITKAVYDVVEYLENPK